MIIFLFLTQDARGDQCDKCSKLINATELKVGCTCEQQWRSQTRAHPGLGPGVSVWKTVGTSYFCSQLFAMMQFPTLSCSHVWRLILVLCARMPKSWVRRKKQKTNACSARASSVTWIRHCSAAISTRGI